MVALKGYQFGMESILRAIFCAQRFQNSLAESSLEKFKCTIEVHDFLNDYCKVGKSSIKIGGCIAFQFSELDRNIASIKSMGRILLCWVDEAEPVTEPAWQTLILLYVKKEKDDEQSCGAHGNRYVRIPPRSSFVFPTMRQLSVLRSTSQIIRNFQRSRMKRGWMILTIVQRTTNIFGKGII